MPPNNYSNNCSDLCGSTLEPTTIDNNDNDELSQGLYTLALAAVQFCLGFPIGLTLVLLTLRSPELRRGMHNLLICNILISEMMLLITCLMSAALVDRGMKNEIPCKVIGFLLYMCGLSTWFSYVLLAMERYSSLIHNPLLDLSFQVRNAKYLLAATWICPMLQMLPFAATASESLGFEEMQVCGIVVSSETWKVAYYLMVILNTPSVCHGLSMRYNIKIYHLLRSHKQKAVKLGSGQLTVRDFDAVSKLLFTYCMLPILFQMPLAVAKAVAPLGSNNWVSCVLGTMYLVPPMVSPYLVLHFLKPYRVALAYCLIRGCGVDVEDSGTRTAPPVDRGHVTMF